MPKNWPNKYRNIFGHLRISQQISEKSVGYQRIDQRNKQIYLEGNKITKWIQKYIWAEDNQKYDYK